MVGRRCAAAAPILSLVSFALILIACQSIRVNKGLGAPVWNPSQDVQSDGSLAPHRSADPPKISVQDAMAFHGKATFFNPLDQKYVDNCKIPGTVQSAPSDKNAQVIVYCAHQR